MKGFGYLSQGGGLYSSSSSNLSPLAPPFNVDSTFTIPENFHEQTSSHYVYSARPNNNPPSHDNWLNLNTPGYGFPNPNTNTNTSPNSEMESSYPSGYGQFMTSPLSIQSVSRPYHPQYAPVMSQGGSVGMDVNVNERGGGGGGGGMLPNVGGYWDSKNNGEQWKGKGKDGNKSGASVFARYTNEGISSDGTSARDEAPRVWVGKSTESSPGDFFTGSEGIFLPPRKQSSASNENSRSTRFDMSKAPVLNPSSLQEKPYLGPSPDFVMESWSQPYPSPASYGKYFAGGGDSYRTDPLCFYPKSSQSSVDPIYESPSIFAKPSAFVTKTIPTNLSPIERPRDAFDRKADSVMRSPSSKECDAVNSEKSDFYKADHSASMQLNLLTSGDAANIEKSDFYKGDHSATLQLNLLPSVDPFGHVFKAKKKVQVTDPSNLPSTMQTTATDSEEYSSEVLEQFNPGVDSPCWKGASDSRYSLFGVSEVGTSDIPEKISEGCNSSSLHGPSNSGIGVAFPCMESEKCSKEDGPSSPSSHTEWLSDFTKPNLQPINTLSGDQLPRVDVVISVMQNISEILLSYCSNDKSALKEQDLVGIGQVITTLKNCLVRDDTVEQSPKVQFLQSDEQNITEKQGNVPEVTIPVEIDAERSSKVKKNSNMSSSIKGDNSTTTALPSCGSELEYDHMTKGIKKILEENFHEEVEPDIQNLLYKNLWLEAEAALCAVKYKERFARMKTEMEKYKQHPEKGNLMDVEELIEVNGGSEVSNISEQNPNLGSSTANEDADVDASVLARSLILQSRPSQESEVPNPNLEKIPKENEEELNTTSTGTRTGDIDASVLARSRILQLRTGQVSEVSNTSLEKNWKENEEEVNTTSTGNRMGDMDDSVLARFQILQARINRTVVPKPCGTEEDIVMKPQKPNILKHTFTGTKTPLQFIGESSEGNSYVVDTKTYSGKYQWPFIRENYNVEHRKEDADAAMGSGTFVDPFSSSGESDSPSPPSDWEHVLKDAAWPA